MSKRKRSFKEEFQLKKIRYNFDDFGESKLIFVQSKINCISPTSILLFRLFTATYLIFAAILSIVTHTTPQNWILFMTSCNYLIVTIYFCYGFSLSCQAVFCKINFCRGDGGTVKHRYPGRNVASKNGIHHVDMVNIDQNKNTTEPIKSTRNTTESTSRLTENRFSVASIILDIEENSKRLSMAAPDDNRNSREIRHARFEDNRLPSIQSDVFIESITDISLSFKLYWFLSNVALNLSCLVVSVYWIALFPYQDPVSDLKWYLRIDRHGIILILLLLDHVITKTPIRVLHFVYPSIMFTIYGIYNAVYTKITSTVIYPAMDFKDDTVKAILTVAGAALIGVPLIQVGLYWVIYRLKERIFGMV